MPKSKYELDFAPWPHQGAVISCPARNQVWLFHRRAGKTMAAVHLMALELLKRRTGRGALQMPKGFYIAAELKMAKNIAWPALQHIARQFEGCGEVVVNKQDYYVEFMGCRIQLLGASDDMRLRGVYSDITILDEAQHLHPDIMTAVMPTLTDYRGRLIICGTPMGMNQFKKWYDHAEQNKTGEWAAFTYRASETEVFSDADLEKTKQDLGVDAYEQEYECSWSAAVQGAFYGRAMQECIADGRVHNKDIYNPNLPVYTAWDLGYSDTNVIWFFQIVDNKLHFIDCYFNSGETLHHYAQNILSRGFVHKRAFVPHDIQTGQYELGTSRMELLQSLGLNPEVVNTGKGHKVYDGIDLVRRNFYRIHFGVKCIGLPVDSLSLYRARYNAQTEVYSEIPIHDKYSHFADAFRYAMIGADGLVDDNRAHNPQPTHHYNPLENRLRVIGNPQPPTFPHAF